MLDPQPAPRIGAPPNVARPARDERSPRGAHPDLVLLPPGHPNVLELEALPPQLNWPAIFGSSGNGDPRKTVLELGCATGTFLLHRADQLPAANLIGVEFANKYFIKAAERARKRNLTNIRVIRTEASQFVCSRLADRSLDECHIYHPDPWPKERHHKRRLIQPPFLSALQRVLSPGGFIVFQSDHEEYFGWAMERIQRTFRVELHPQAWPDAPDGRTNWEIKFLRQGLPIWRLIARLHG